MTESSKTDSILSSILKVEHHYHGDQRSQGTRFKASYVWIENGPPQKKNMRGNNQFGGNRRGMPYDRNQSRSHQRYERQDESSFDNRRESYRHTNRYEQPDEYNQREYQRHKRNNNSHLAQHYKQKADRSRR